MVTGSRNVMSRREFLALAAKFGAGVAVGGGLASLVAACGGTPATVATTITVPTTAMTSPTTVSTASTTATMPSPTITQATTTTTARSFASLINPSVTLAMVKNSEFSFADNRSATGEQRPINVSERLAQDALEHCGLILAEICPGNRAVDQNTLAGNELNAVYYGSRISNSMTYFADIPTEGGLTVAVDEKTGEGTWYKVSQSLACSPIVPVKQVTPWSKSTDFYTYDEKVGTFVRIVRDKSGKYRQTILAYCDLRNASAFDTSVIPGTYDLPSRGSGLDVDREDCRAGRLGEESLAEYFEPLSTFGYYMQPYEARNKYKADENGVPVARLAFGVGYAGIQERKARVFGTTAAGS